MEYTEGQKQAINDHPKGNILVSASAGSGKTRVLVDRIIKMVITQNVNIDKLLVVTFTKAAAKEMKERLQLALRSEYQATDNPEQKRHLLWQLHKVPVADITTIDAFCQKLVGRYYYLLGMDPNFRMLTDATEIDLLREQVWDDLREELYRDDDDGSFAALTENFSNDRSDDGLTKLIMKIYDFANVNDHPAQWLANAANFYHLDSEQLADTQLFKQYIQPELQLAVSSMQMMINQMIQNAQLGELPKDEKLANQFNEQVKMIQTQLLQPDWNELRDLLQQFNNPRLSAAPRGAEPEQKELHEQNKQLKTDIIKTINELADGYFELAQGATVTLIQQAMQRVDKLVTVVQAFSAAYDQAKKARQLMEFIDVEHAAYRILTNASEPGQQIKAKLQNQYVEIMVDEYQDNNRLQEAILSQLAKPEAGNRFMVGDVKQSIYRFRLSDPTMFIDKQTRYATDNTADELINLVENFRSTKNVTDFANLIFEQIMDQRVGDVDYVGPAHLKFGAKYYPEAATTTAELLLYQENNAKDAQSLAVNATFVPEDGANGQAELIAQQIRQLVDDQVEIYDRHAQVMRPIKYGDVAILSPTHTNDLVLAEVLEKYAIPATINQAKSYFKTTEIQIMMALLSIIDNPYQDIALVAVLRSPIVGLDENQLAFMRINQQTGNYYQAVLNFYQNFETSQATPFGAAVFAKISRFMEQLQQFRDLAQQRDLVTLIWTIYQETGFLDYVGGMPAGYQRQANLHALYERAAQYEQTSFKGVFQFVRFIERMQERDDDLGQANIETGADTVLVTTIHGSKGLEFPVVFINDLNRQFNMQDTRAKYELDDQLGVGITYFNLATREESNTLQKKIISNHAKRAAISEEMRKLYVAVTRAEQKLYLVGSFKHKKNQPTDEAGFVQLWQGKTNANELLLPESVRLKANNYLDWVGPAIARHPQISGSQPTMSVLAKDETQLAFHLVTAAQLAEHQPTELETTEQATNWITALNQMNDAAMEDAVITKQQIDNEMDFVYPYQAATKTTAYQSVSEVKRLFDDPDNIELGSYQLLDVDQVGQVKPAFVTPFGRPKFLQTTSQASAAEVGTATHLVLQQMQLKEPPTIPTITAQIQQLVSDQVISEMVASQINVTGIMNFYQSELGQLVLDNAATTNREVPFSVLLNADQIFTGFQDDPNQSVLIHGIIDGYTVAEDELILFDYKTDHVTPKNSVDQIVARYRGQVELYATALSQILKRPVNHKYLYLLDVNQTIAVK